MDETPKNARTQEEMPDFNIKDFLKLCLSKWLWFTICIVCSVGIALFYIYTKQPQYHRYEQILINNQDSGGGVGEISNSFSSLGLFSKNTNIYNELLALTSPAVLYEVADSLELDMSYLERDGLRYKTLYGTNLPFKIKMEDIGDQGSASFKMNVKPNGDMEFYKFARIFPDGKVKYKDEISVKAGTLQFDSPIGKISILPNPKYIAESKEPKQKTIKVGKLPMQSTVELYGQMLKGDLADEDADVIELSIDDVSVQRAVDILNYVLMVYNQNWITDKNKISIATSNFINDRLKVIETELGDVDKNIAEYLKTSGTVNMGDATRIQMEKGSQTEQDLIRVDNEITMNKYMQEFVNDPANRNSILPTNIAGGDISPQILAYNELLLSRNNIASNSSEANPLVKQYDAQLAEMRSVIDKTLANQMARLQNARNTYSKELNKNKSAVSTMPEKRLPLLSEERQQAVKQSLYLFLLQKREENELTQKFTDDNIRIITPPVGSLKPVSPRKGLIIIVSLILGLGIPIILIYFLESINTTIRDKKDLDGLLMPFAGEIPQVGEKTNLKKFKEKNLLRRKKDDEAPITVVEAGKRDIVNEAFRVVRGNLDFMSGKNEGPQSIMITSFNPGSGKSFIAYNLGLSYSIKNKKVLIVDCDLRHGSSSMYVGKPKEGLSDYLSGADKDWKNLVVRTQANANLDVMPIGKIPPNPAELLEDRRFGTLIEEAKKNYDIIFLDCPPVNIVVDSQIVAKWADRTIFVLRASLLEKSALKELNEFYEEKKYKNISVILNGTKATRSRYYTYGNYQHLN